MNSAGKEGPQALDRISAETLEQPAKLPMTNAEVKAHDKAPVANLDLRAASDCIVKTPTPTVKSQEEISRKLMEWDGKFKPGSVLKGTEDREADQNQAPHPYLPKDKTPT